MSRLSRREFLKIATSGALVPFLPNPNQLAQPDFKPDIEILPTIRVGKLLLTPILTEHTQKAWEKNGNTILDVVSQNDLVIPEYFPPDYNSQLEQDPLLESILKNLTEYDQLNILFDHLEPKLMEAQKKVLVVDPAYNNAAAWYRVKENWPYGVGVFASAGLTGYISHNISHNENVSLIKRTLGTITTIAAGTGVTVASGIATTGEKNLGEFEMRRVLIASALVQLGYKELTATTKATIIYPSGHWRGSNDFSDGIGPSHGISHYLENEVDRLSSLDALSRLKASRLFTPLFETRAFEPVQNRWKQVPGFTIENSHP